MNGQPVKVVAKWHLGCYDVVRPRSASPWAVEELVERFVRSDFVDADLSAAGLRNADRRCQAAAQARADEINADEAVS